MTARDNWRPRCVQINSFPTLAFLLLRRRVLALLVDLRSRSRCQGVHEAMSQEVRCNDGKWGLDLQNKSVCDLKNLLPAHNCNHRGSLFPRVIQFSDSLRATLLLTTFIGTWFTSPSTSFCFLRLAGSYHPWSVGRVDWLKKSSGVGSAIEIFGLWPQRCVVSETDHALFLSAGRHYVRVFHIGIGM